MDMFCTKNLNAVSHNKILIKPYCNSDNNDEHASVSNLKMLSFTNQLKECLIFLSILQRALLFNIGANTFGLIQISDV